MNYFVNNLKLKLIVNISVSGTTSCSNIRWLSLYFAFSLILFDVTALSYNATVSSPLPLFDGSLSILGTLAALCSEFFDYLVAVSSLGLQLHSPLLPPESLDLDLAGISGTVGCLRDLSRICLVKLLLREVLLIFTVLYIDGQTLWGQESEPLKGLRVQTHLGKGILPVGQPQVHDHQTEIVCESIRYKEPGAGKVLEPNLWFIGVSSVHEGQSPVFDLGINVKSSYVLPSEKLL